MAPNELGGQSWVMKSMLYVGYKDMQKYQHDALCQGQAYNTKLLYAKVKNRMGQPMTISLENYTSFKATVSRF